MATPADAIKHLRTAEERWPRRSNRAAALIDGVESALRVTDGLNINFTNGEIRNNIRRLLVAIAAFSAPEFGRDTDLETLQNELSSFYKS